MAKKANKKADIDFESDKDVASESDLKKISEKADKAVEIATRIKKGEALLKSLGEDLRAIVEEDIPEMMLACGVDGFTTSKGFGVTLKQFSIGSLPSSGAIEKAKPDVREELKQRLEDGLEFIRNNKGEDIIKSAASIPIGKDSELRKKIDKLLKAEEIDFDISDSVHPQTLNSWLREKGESGIDLPQEVFKIFSGKKALISTPKISRRK